MAAERRPATTPTPEPQGRGFDPDWSLSLALFAVCWFAVVIVVSWFFWNWVTP